MVFFFLCVCGCIHKGRKMVVGSMVGGIKETQEMVDLAGKHNITADIELISADYVNTAMFSIV